MPAPLPPISPAIFDSEPPRYRKVVKPVSLRRAKEIRRKRVRFLQNKIKALKEELAELRSQPLQTETVTMERIFPGDPEYTSTPLFGWKHYEGDLRWLNPKDQ